MPIDAGTSLRLPGMKYTHDVKRQVNATLSAGALSAGAPTGMRPDSNAVQAKYFVEQLESWASKIEHEIAGRRTADAVSHAKRRELYEVRRQIDALHARYPLVFGMNARQTR
ncbi:hypothetical protein DFR67_108209 [Williamsia limnetica]|uniref:Uncharacterized protein n=1 Tax=Williamsia limnetica TaxID=882452 RepID=A0A318RHB6_WILLI|nr:hypothetical protein DFR67_108209 [Williamsia limnetica]